jgi:hypothetical protein
VRKNQCSFPGRAVTWLSTIFASQLSIVTSESSSV